MDTPGHITCPGFPNLRPDYNPINCDGICPITTVFPIATIFAHYRLGKLPGAHLELRRVCISQLHGHNQRQSVISLLLILLASSSATFS